VDEQMYESSGDCPWSQSTDLDLDAAQAAAERREWAQAMAAEAWAAFVAKLADQRREEDSADEAQQAGCRRVRISAVEVA